MLCYWILKRPDGKAVGLVRVQNDRALLTLTGKTEGRFALLSETDALPIMPGAETQLSGAAAVLGTEGERLTCFALAPDAKPLSHYRAILSRFYTMQNGRSAEPQAEPSPSENMSHISTTQTEQAVKSAVSSDNISRFNTIYKGESDSVADTARDAETFSLLLRRAEAFYAAYEETSRTDHMVQNEDIYMKEPQSGIALFPQEYPGARWRYIEGTDVLPHYEGTWRQPSGQTLHILAVRGRAAPRPPRALLGFTRFLRDGDGTGYWLRLTPLP